MDATITITAEEVQILNNIITNSTPTIPLGKVNTFIAKINQQLQTQFSKQKEEVEVEPEK